MIDTELTIRGFEVWAVEPHHYRHYHTLFVRVPGAFPTEVYEEQPGRWNIGYTRPDGRRTATYGSFATRDEAEEARATYRGATEASLQCPFAVGYKTTDADGNYLSLGHCAADEPGAKAWGTTWANAKWDYEPLRFDLTEREAAQVLAWREQADAAWFAAHPEFLSREQHITEAQVAGMSLAASEFYLDARAAFGAAAQAVVSRPSPTETECMECGAVYEEGGRVELGGMGCDRCAPKDHQ